MAAEPLGRFGALPNEAISLIFNNLDAHTLCRWRKSAFTFMLLLLMITLSRVGWTCKTLNQISRDSNLWKKFSKLDLAYDFPQCKDVNAGFGSNAVDCSDSVLGNVMGWFKKHTPSLHPRPCRVIITGIEFVGKVEISAITITTRLPRSLPSRDYHHHRCDHTISIIINITISISITNLAMVRPLYWTNWTSLMQTTLLACILHHHMKECHWHCVAGTEAGVKKHVSCNTLSLAGECQLFVHNMHIMQSCSIFVPNRLLCEVQALI